MIEFQFFKGCPHSEQTLRNLLSLVAEGFLKENEIIITEVSDPPTILVDGYDIYTEKVPETFNFSCRIYNINGIQTGVLPREFIKTQIEKLRAQTR